VSHVENCDKIVCHFVIIRPLDNTFAENSDDLFLNGISMFELFLCVNIVV